MRIGQTPKAPLTHIDQRSVHQYFYRVKTLKKEIVHGLTQYDHFK